MKNSALKRIIAVLLCLAVFAVSELSGVTNVVRDLYAEEMDDGSETSEDADSNDKTDNSGGPTEAVEEVALEPSSAEDTAQPADQPQGNPGTETTESETTTGGEAGTEPGSEAVNPDGTEAAEGEAQDGEQKEDGAPAEAGSETETGTEGTETPAGTEQEAVFEGQLAEAKEGGPEVTAAAVNPEEKPEPILKLVNDEDDNITVTAEAEKAGIIPDGASLSVTPIEKKEVTDDMEDEEKAKTEEINAQYDLTAEKLQEASEQREDDIVGFLAYNICFTDEEGNKLTPDGEVKMKFEYKVAVIPEEVKETGFENTGVTVMHLAEDEDGEVNKAVDMAEEDKLGDVQVNENQEVETTEFVTDGSDTSDIYAVAWVGDVGVYTYQDEEVTITVSEEEENAIPEGSRLRVLPILAKEKTADQYQEVAEKLLEKAENEEYNIAGFLAYDISLIDKEGNKMEPNGKVKVSMNYNQAAIPEEVKEASATLAEESDEEIKPEEMPATDITVMHLEENPDGEVTQVVDLAEEDTTAIDSTDLQEVWGAEFVTESFSVFTITWKYNSGIFDRTLNVEIYYVNEEYRQIDISQNTEKEEKDPTDTTPIELKKYVCNAQDTNYVFDRIVIKDNAGREIPISELKCDDVYENYGQHYKVQRNNKDGNGVWQNGEWSMEGSDSWTDFADRYTKGYVYIVYKSTGEIDPPAPPEPDAESTVPLHRKYITANPDGTYNLTLDVTGRQDKPNPIDVLFIVDTSGSMNATRRRNVNTAINSLTTTLTDAKESNKSLKDVEINLGVVTFATSAGTAQGWRELSEFNWSLNSVGGGTNWQAGIRTGNSMLSGRPAANRKYVVFITDGDPTYRYSASGSVTGAGNYDDGGRNYSAAVTEWQKSQSLKSAAGIYIVDANPSENNKCAAFASAVGAVKLEGNSAEKMNTSFQTIADAITNPGYTDVKITDTLSDYVEFDFSEDGEVKYEVTKTQNGTSTTLAKGTDYEITRRGKTIALDLSPSGKLDNDAVYSISFTVKPTQKAAEADKDSLQKGENDTDDPNIDDPNEYISTGKDGVRTNKDATISYKYNNIQNDSDDPDVKYPHPVIQVDAEHIPAQPSLETTKTAKVKDWNDRTYEIDIMAKSNVKDTGSTTTTVTADVMLVLDMSWSMGWKVGPDGNINRTSKGSFSSVQDELEKDKVYYYGNHQYTRDVSGGGAPTVQYLTYPMVYIENKWQYYNGSGWQTPSDSDYTQIYEWESRITALKEAAISFVKKVASESPESKIGVVKFNSGASIVNRLDKVSANPTGLIKNIAALSMGSNTKLNQGLNKAKDSLSESKADNIPQYVVVFGDGAIEDPYDSERTATSLKNSNVTIYTIGLGNAASTSLNPIASEPKEKYALSVSDTSDLNAAFGTITSEFSTPVPIEGATVIDVIDPKFELLVPDPDDSTKLIPISKEEYPYTLTVGSVTATVTLDANGNQVVTWNNQTINCTEADKWHQTLTVKAKDAYIGGNNVPTNISPDSRIITNVEGVGTVTLPQPTVNVRAVFTVADKEITIYKGDFIPASPDVLNSLFDAQAIAREYDLDPKDFVCKWYKDEACTQETSPAEMALVNADVDTDISPNTPYCYYLKVSYNVGQPTEESTSNTNNNIAGNEQTDGTRTLVDQGCYKIHTISGAIDITKKLESEVDEDNGATFKFRVKKVDWADYDPDLNPEESSNDNDTSSETSKDILADSDATDPDSDSGTSNSPNPETADLSNPDAEEVIVEITVPKGKTEARLSEEEKERLAKLPRGSYAVTEVLDEESTYEIKSIENDSQRTNCQNDLRLSATPQTIIFTLGYDTDKADVIRNYEYKGEYGGTLGATIFTNEKVQSNWNIVKRSASDHSKYLPAARFELTSTDLNPTVTYIGISNANGVVTWNTVEKDEKGNETLKPFDKAMTPGTYTLAETVSPDSYMKSEETWTITLVRNGKLKEVNSSSSGPVNPDENGNYYFDNTLIYELPSTGGIGIHWYTIGGTLLMMAGMLILYRNKKRYAGRC